MEFFNKGSRLTLNPKPLLPQSSRPKLPCLVSISRASQTSRHEVPVLQSHRNIITILSGEGILKPVFHYAPVHGFGKFQCLYLEACWEGGRQIICCTELLLFAASLSAEKYLCTDSERILKLGSSNFTWVLNNVPEHVNQNLLFS